MKQQAIQYLAFDVHQATTVASLRNASGSVVMRASVATEARALVQLVRSAGPRVKVAFEEGTQAQWLHDLLVPHAEQVVVCNTRGKSETGNKSDRLDADGLSEALRAGTLRPVFHGSPNVLTLRKSWGPVRKTNFFSAACGPWLGLVRSPGFGPSPAARHITHPRSGGDGLSLNRAPRALALSTSTSRQKVGFPELTPTFGVFPSDARCVIQCAS